MNTSILHPTLLLDKSRVERNIERMVARAAAAGVELRPHFKTHQSQAVAEWCKAAGIRKATVSSLRMAAYFAAAGWDDITVAFPVNVREVDAVNELASRIRLQILVEHRDAIAAFAERLQHPVRVMIKVDTGYHRAGILYKNLSEIRRLAAAIDAAPQLRFAGVLHHAGHSYQARNRAQIMEVHRESLANMAEVAEALRGAYPDLEVSVGDTPTCSVADSFGVATELRPGNFVYYDLMMVQIGACDHDDIAVAMACPVVSKYPDRGEVMIYGGGVHFSKDALKMGNGHQIYGRVAADEGALGWGSVVPGVELRRLSQEHGVLSAPREWIERIAVGDVVKVLPVHSCMTADVMKQYRTTEGETIDMMRLWEW